MQVWEGCDDIQVSSKAKCQVRSAPSDRASLRTRCGATTPHLVRLFPGCTPHPLA
jgi:hypothetical protein